VPSARGLQAFERLVYSSGVSLSENNYFAVATTPRRWVLATLLRSLPELAASLESAPHMPLSFIASEFVLRALQLSSMPATLSGYVPKFP